jgi:DNA repair exonuclease SbcCD nuclease subunit
MLKKSKVAIFSDLHLGLYGNSEQWHDVALKWADWIVGELNQQKIKDIFFLGDFFHNRSEISVQTIHVASQILEKFEDFNMVMIVGNHDAYYKNRSDVHSLGLLNGHKNLTIVDKNLTIEEFDKTLLFVPWNSEVPDGKFDYIFGHFEILNFKMNNYKVCDHGLSAMDLLASRTGNVYSGHFHLRNSKKFNEGNIHYVGNTFPHDFNDYGNTKGYHILDIEDGTLEFFENTVSPKFNKIFLSKIKTYTKEDFENNVIKFIVDIEANEKQVEKVQTYISKFKPFQFHTEYNTVTKSIDDIEEIDAIDLMDSIEEFIDQLKFEEEKDNRILKIMKDLYERNK